MSVAMVVLIVLLCLVVVVALVLGTIFTPRSRWWQAWQNRTHNNRPGPGGPRFP